MPIVTFISRFILLPGFLASMFLNVDMVANWETCLWIDLSFGTEMGNRWPLRYPARCLRLLPSNDGLAMQVVWAVPDEHPANTIASLSLLMSISKGGDR